MNSAVLRLRPLGIDTHREFVIYMRRDCHVCRAEGFQAQTRAEWRFWQQTLRSTIREYQGVDRHLAAPMNPRSISSTDD